MRALLILLLASSAAFAQPGSSIAFRALQERARMTVTLWPMNETRAIDAADAVVFAELAAGDYRAEITASGFTPVDTSFRLASGETREIWIALRAITVLSDVTVETTRERLGALTFERTEIERSAAPSLAEFLERQAGLDVRSDGIAGAAKNVRIGGSSTNQVLVLVDGRRIQDFGSGSADLSAIPLDWIEKVEVFRGGQTAAGGDAIGGIVNIVTRDPSAAHELSAQSAWRETHQQFSVTRGAKFDGISGLFSYSRLQGLGNYRYTISEDDGIEQYTPNLGQSSRRVNADVARDQIFLKLTTGLCGIWRGSVTGMLDRAERGMPGYLAPYLTPLARQQTSQSAVNGALSQHRGAHDTEFRASYQQGWKEFENPDPLAIVKHNEETSREWEAEARGSLRLKRAIISGGGSVAREMLLGDHLAADAVTRDRWAAWGQWQQQLVRKSGVNVRGETGLREESFGDDRALLPRLSLSGDYASSWRTGVTLSWGESYRAPDFYALFWQEDQSAQGNPELKPELSQEWTGSAFIELATQSRTRCEVSGSDQRIGDLIYWRRTFDNQWKPFNLKAATVRTLDASLSQILWNERLRVQLAANWTEARDATHDRNTGGKYLTFRPLFSQRVNASYDDRRFRAALSYRRVSKRAVLETNSKWLRAYQIVDAHLSCRTKLHRVELEPEIGVDNLFNENYRIIRFAPMPGREWYLSLRLTVS